MPTLTQATKLMATCFGQDENRLNKVREALVRNGQLPAASGRDIPLATPERSALLFMGLGLSDPERIAELADLRRFIEAPGDMADGVTLGDVLATTIRGLTDNPDVGVDMRLTLTSQGTPYGLLVASGEVLMQFGEVFVGHPSVHHTVSLDMRPLNAFCDAARAMKPPYKVK